jgi:hypothetical protein
MKNKQKAIAKQLIRAHASLEALANHLEEKGLEIECDLVEAVAGHVEGAREMLTL